MSRKSEIQETVASLDDRLRNIWNGSRTHETAANLLERAGEAIAENDLGRAEDLARRVSDMPCMQVREP